MQITLVAAMGENRAMGLKGRLPWPSLPDDTAHVFALIKGKKTIMGKKSYFTPDRIESNYGNMVVSRLQDIVLDPHFEYAASIEQAFLKLANEPEVIVLGGAMIYEQVINDADLIHLTVVHGTFLGDAFFPPVDEKRFELTHTVFHPADALHPYSFSFLTYKKRMTA